MRMKIPATPATHQELFEAFAEYAVEVIEEWGGGSKEEYAELNEWANKYATAHSLTPIEICSFEGIKSVPR